MPTHILRHHGHPPLNLATVPSAIAGPSTTNDGNEGRLFWIDECLLEWATIGEARARIAARYRPLRRYDLPAIRYALTMTLDLTDGEASALAAHLHLILDADPFLLVPRLDPLRSILGKLERNANVLSLPRTGADDLPSAPRQEPKRLNAFQPPLGPAVIKPTDPPGKTPARLCGKCDGAGRFSNKLCEACNGTGVELVSDP